MLKRAPGRPPLPHNRPRKGMSPLQSGLADAIARMEAATGHKLTEDEQIIPDDMTFVQWVEKLAQPVTDPETGRVTPGLKVDGRPFKLSNRPAMAWVYGLIPTTRAEALRRVVVLMKCAQVGFTVMEMLAVIYLGLKFGPCTIGMFLPDVALAEGKSTERFMPIVRTIPDAHRLMTQDAPDGTGRKQGEGNVRRRRIGEALFLFSWTSGKASTESFPMDILSFDEVQEMSIEQMEKTEERLSASEIKFTLMGSTANWPDSDIHFQYKKGTQHAFHTECPTCGVKEPLDDYFPDCIRWDPEHPDELTKVPGAYRYVCRAGHWIDDSQHGEWIAKFPDAWIISAHFPQMLSPTISPGEIMSKWVNSRDKKNFYNRVLGKPYLDPSQVPVTLEHMANCVAHGKAMGLTWKKRAHGTYMGIDQMGSFNVVIIKERLPDGRQAVVHVEEIYDLDPFSRCDELMEIYGVAVCVVEINPNVNDARRFSQRHRGKVFICSSFGVLPDDMVRWGDEPTMDASDRRTNEEERDRYTVRCDQFRCMQASMAKFTGPKPLCLWPDDQELVQEVIEKGVKQRAAIAPRAFLHFTKTALVVERDEEAGTNKFKRTVKKISIDPHFSYANQLCDVAWARSHGTTQFIVPDPVTQAEERAVMAVEMNAPGLPGHVVGMLQQGALQGSVCGRCQAYPFGGETLPVEGRCSDRNLIVQASDPGCPFFAARE